MSVMSNEVLGCLYLTLRKTGVQHVFDVVFRGGLWLGLQVITLENLLSLAGQNKASAGGGGGGGGGRAAGGVVQLPLSALAGLNVNSATSTSTVATPPFFSTISFHLLLLCSKTGPGTMWQVLQRW